MKLTQVIAEAVKDMELHGYDDQARVDHWLIKIREAALSEMLTDAQTEAVLRRSLTAKFNRVFESKRFQESIPRFNKAKLKPKLLDELDRRIMASANLIKLNREEAIQKTLRRFSGWSTSIPAGGGVADKEVKKDLRTSISQLSFIERRVAIDQGHKLIAAIEEIAAVDSGALGAIWHSRWRVENYNYRPDHKERDGVFYVVPDNWAIQKGFMKTKPSINSITRPAEEVYCFPADSNIPFAHGISKAYRRFYTGELSVIVTSTGNIIRATPNHPVLTDTGWRAISSLNEGDNVIEIPSEIIHIFEKNKNNGIATISDIFAAVNKNGIVKSFGLSRTDFHGDGIADSNVDIVFTACPLTYDAISQRLKLVKYFNLAMSNISFAISGSFFKSFNRLLGSPNSIVGVFSKGGAFLWRHVFHAYNLSLSLASNVKTKAIKPINNGSSTNIKLTGYALDAMTIGIKLKKQFQVNTNAFFFNWFGRFKSNLMKLCIESGFVDANNVSYLSNIMALGMKQAHVIKVDRESFSGHVYNLETKGNWYIVNGIITHNCQCHYQYVYALKKVPDELLTAKGREALSAIQK
mgnify:CR=1 FL=1